MSAVGACFGRRRLSTFRGVYFHPITSCAVPHGAVWVRLGDAASRHRSGVFYVLHQSRFTRRLSAFLRPLQLSARLWNGIAPCDGRLLCNVLSRSRSSGFRSGRSVAWLARLLGVQEVESSNLSAPTIFSSGFVGFCFLPNTFLTRLLPP